MIRWYEIRLETTRQDELREDDGMKQDVMRRDDELRWDMMGYDEMIW